MPKKTLRQIWKWPLVINDLQFIADVPAGAKPLSVQMQHGDPTLWMLVDPSASHEIVRIAVVGTGHDFDPTGWQYIGTVQHRPFVWHVFYPEDGAT